MDSRRTSELRDAHDGVFDIARGDHHEVGEFVDDNEQVRVRPQCAFRAGKRREFAVGHGLIEVVDVTEAERVQIVVAHVHFFDNPLQRFGGLLGIRDDGRDEVRNALIRRELDALGVDKNKANLGGSRSHQDRGNHRVDERRLTGARCTRDEKVGHFGEVGDDELPLNVFANPNRHWVVCRDCLRGTQDVTERDNVAIGVGDFDSDGRLAGNRCQECHFVRRDRVLDVARECGDSLDLDAGSDFDLVPSNRRSAREAGDRRVDLELREDFGDGRDDLVVDGR